MLHVRHIRSLRTQPVLEQTQPGLDVVPFRHRLTALATGQFVLALVGIVLTVVQAELAWNANFDSAAFECRRDSAAITPSCAASFEPVFPFTSNLPIINAVRWASSVVTVCLLIANCLHHRLAVKYLIVRGAFPPSAHTCGGAWPEDGFFVLEMLVCVLHTPPYLEDLTSDSTAFLVLTLFPFARLYTVFRAYHHRSFLTKAIAKFIGAITLVRFRPSFVLKTWLAVRPVAAGALCGIGFVLTMSYAIRIVESVACVNDLFSLCDPMSFFDSLWLVMTTVTTVGYGGQYVPYSTAGQAVVFVGAGAGVLVMLVSLAVAIVMLNPTSTEADVLHLLRTQDRRLRLRNAAASCIQATWRYQGGFRSSLQWRTGRFGTRYRVVSQRIPLEDHAAREVNRFRALRSRFRADELNMEPAVARTLAMLQLDVHATEVVSRIRHVARVWKESRGIRHQAHTRIPMSSNASLANQPLGEPASLEATPQPTPN